MRAGLHLAATALLVAAPAAAKAPAVEASGWAQAGIGNAAAYVTLHNHQRTADRLISVSSPAAASVSVHRTTKVNGVMRMRSAGAVPIAAGGHLAMQPGGLHIMLMDLKAPLRAGSRLPLTLRFARAGSINLSLPVRAPGAAPMTSHHGH